VKRPVRAKVTFRLSGEVSGQLADYARRKRVSQGSVVEAALASHLSPDGADRLEAALSRRLDRLSRQSDQMQRHLTIANETLALFVRFWLTATPPLPDGHQAAAQAKGRERFEAFVETMGRRLARGRTFADEVIRDLPGEEGEAD
jgi:predicted transcriptional regulator